jgi:ribosomal protein S12 methylthiotransferase accessory factor
MPGCNMRLRSVRKHAPGSERIIAAEKTLPRASLVAAAMGVTRVADITGLDRIGIPVHTAVVPKSDDTISVYNGKGVLPIDSKTGALMEAIERQTALHTRLEVLEGSFRKLRRGRRAVADPRTFNQKLSDGYDENRAYLWTEAYDLISSEPVLVPAAAVGYGPKYATRRSPFHENSSNGLASGNCREEAVCHALCELIERDAFTLAELRSQWMPWAQREAVLGEKGGAEGWDDPNACPRIDLRNAGNPIPELLRKFKRAGLRPILRDITSDLRICCAVASIADASVPGFPQAHCGMGAHPNARIAVVRALTELAQSRAVDIQGAREDLIPAGGPAPASSRHTQRVEKIDERRWILQPRGHRRPFCEMASFQSDDIADDIRFILSRLSRHGMARVLVAELNGPGEFAVVRVMAPGLEYFALDQGKLGPRALQFWRKHAQ